ncbi:MAG TPA: hypothetical protein VNZ44_19205, partial [Pyrinomonadaceae bacterium]|nr:hypothetical protein [Pyrinomonadaceae bacterium]
MLTAAVIASILLSLAALWRARERPRAPRNVVRELAELRDRLGRESATLRAGLDAQRQRAEQQAARIHEQQSKLSELTEAQAEARRGLEGARALGREEEPGGGSGTEEVKTPGAGEEFEEENVFAVARRLEGFFNATTHPRELLGNETFLRGAQ